MIVTAYLTLYSTTEALNQMFTLYSSHSLNIRTYLNKE
jgi:hypothetical protein